MQNDDNNRQALDDGPSGTRARDNSADVRSESRSDSRSEGRSELAELPPHLPIDAHTWRRISRQLVILIGEGGFSALFGRALRMLAPRFSWLSIDPSRRSIDALLDALERDMTLADAAEAAVANTELLRIFIKQLSTLIGEALTIRLLAQVAGAGPEGLEDGQENV